MRFRPSPALISQGRYRGRSQRTPGVLTASQTQGPHAYRGSSGAGTQSPEIPDLCSAHNSGRRHGAPFGFSFASSSRKRSTDIVPGLSPSGSADRASALVLADPEAEALSTAGQPHHTAGGS